MHKSRESLDLDTEVFFSDKHKFGKDYIWKVSASFSEQSPEATAVNVLLKKSRKWYNIILK